jgi:CubicO group peptidase (beta-lactamase class C family)
VIRTVIATVVLAGTCFAQSIDARMDQIVQSFASNKQFMGSVLVARGSEVLFSKSYGLANLDWQIPNTPSTKFRLASVTKQFTAAAVLLLEQRGKLKVDDPIRKYLPEVSSAWEKVTIFHILTHTSGIPNIGSPTPAVGFSTTGENVLRFLEKRLDFEPGEKWNYSNNGYILLGYLIERISGQSYEKFLEKNIFTPLGMRDSGYDTTSAVIARRATGYTQGPNGPVIAPFIHMSVPHAAGALYSTTEDLLRWEQGLFGGKVLSPESLQKMTTPFKNNYAFGLQVRTVNGRKLIDHTGSINGFNTMLAYYPEDKLTVVALGNLNGPAPAQIVARLGALAHGDTVTLANERKEITLHPEVLSRYVGVYQVSPGTNLVITFDKSQLFGKLTSQQALPIFAESETMFFAKAVDAQIEFSENDSKGRPTQLTLYQGGRTTFAKRLNDADEKRISDWAADNAKRAKDQTPAARSEVAVRRFIEELRAGQPNYDLMTSTLGATIRQQLSQLQSSLKEHGAIRSISLQGVGPSGADIYEVQFENGAWEFRILLGPEGKIETAGIRPINQ